MKLKQITTHLDMKSIYKITKLGKVLNPYHPDSNYGDLQPYRLGVFISLPKIGEPFNLLAISNTEPKYYGIRTSPVTKILSDNTFETLNSIYKYEPYVD